MKKETLEKAMEIEEDIRTIENAMGIDHKYRHFELVEHYAGDARVVELPRWMNDRLLAVLAEEKERLERELEALSDDTPQEQGAWQPVQAYSEGDVAKDRDGTLYRAGKLAPERKPSWLERWYNMLPFVIIILDITAFGWLCIRYWETVRSYLDMLFILNCCFAVIFTLFVMSGIETYIKNKKRP